MMKKLYLLFLCVFLTSFTLILKGQDTQEKSKVSSYGSLGVNLGLNGEGLNLYYDRVFKAENDNVGIILGVAGGFNYIYSQKNNGMDQFKQFNQNTSFQDMGKSNRFYSAERIPLYLRLLLTFNDREGSYFYMGIIMGAVRTSYNYWDNSSPFMQSSMDNHFLGGYVFGRNFKFSDRLSGIVEINLSAFNGSQKWFQYNYFGCSALNLGVKYKL